ncbi:hypothetical protein CN155_21245 [Sinorhizobium meliloti]|uniref:hypothetical protein n=1 Tax=Rhizobium meliloti TaxID=382 RepID=UPI000FDAB202|nr:hypothetical protein [Sinorhizobium meliloti]MDE3795747.1 hypothetical protein [Sinorhizobium meliloti]RVK52842.1 hypothetical protein CN155_21245 [Sinorhizobium meliloti]
MQNLVGMLSHNAPLAAASYFASILDVLGGWRQPRVDHLPLRDAEGLADGQCFEDSPIMKATAPLHLIALGACLVVQIGAVDLSGTQGVRRALQTMETRSESSSQRGAAGCQCRGAHHHHS